MATAVEYLPQDLVRNRDRLIIDQKLAELSSLARGVQSILRPRRWDRFQLSRSDVLRAFDTVGRANALILELRLLSLTEDDEEQVIGARHFWRSALEMVRYNQRQTR